MFFAANMISFATVCTLGIRENACLFFFWKTSLADLIPKGILVSQYHSYGVLKVHRWELNQVVFANIHLSSQEWKI